MESETAEHHLFQPRLSSPLTNTNVHWLDAASVGPPFSEEFAKSLHTHSSHF